jgi:rhodanese-related sulfurtransferase
MDHAGDLSPEDVYRRLESDPDFTLVDVRTRAEWSYVGIPMVPGREPLFIEWTRFPDGSPNPTFLRELEESGIDPDAGVAFICRSGVRSAAAAAAATIAGFRQAFNVAGGFEGDIDQAGHRGSVNGWKVAGLPWKQT